MAGSVSIIVPTRDCGRSHQLGDGGGLGQVVPVFLRHVLAASRSRFSARRVEGALVIALPAGLEGVGRGRVGAVGRAARWSGSRGPSAASRRGVRIDQSSERKRSTKKSAVASRMKWSGSNQATKRSSASPSTRRKRRKACILCRSRRTAFAMPLEAEDQRIAGDLQQVALAVQQRARSACRAARSARGRGGRPPVGSGRPPRAAARSAGAASQPARRAKEASASPVVVQVDLVAAGRRRRRASRTRLAKAVEVGAGRARSDAARHQNRLSCCGRRDEPAAQVEPIGRGPSARWSAATRKGAARFSAGGEPGEVVEPQPLWRRAAMIWSTARAPRPGTRSSISRGARLTSTGKRSRCFSAQASLGSIVEVEHAAVAAGGDLVDARSRRSGSASRPGRAGARAAAAAASAAGRALGSGIGLKAE